MNVDGSWHWSHESRADGVLRSESENWVLVGNGPQVSGHILRRVTFVAEGDEPFACSQSRSFSLETRFEVSGARTAEAASLRELSATPIASPCRARTPELTTYQLRAEGGQLVAAWGAGEQHLAPSASPAPTAREGIAGDWTWQTTSTTDDDGAGTIRREREDWHLAIEGENIEGDYVRTVALERAAGLSCAPGQTSVELVDRYRVRGWIRDSRLEISEIAAETTAHPCAPDEGRHLDVATAAAFRDHIVLRWRADRRQVLSRAQ